MKLILTSSLGSSRLTEEGWQPQAIDNGNGLRDLLRKLGQGQEWLLLCSDPKAYAANDQLLADKRESLRLSDIQPAGLHLCDNRQAARLPQLVKNCGMLLLGGGHVPTQNRFFRQRGLAELLQGYQGVVLGVSAGSMNCAATVYAPPELPGEAADRLYQRYLTGLGLTSFSLLPHFQQLQNQELDGLRLWEQVCLPDSQRRPFYPLADGGYLYQEQEQASFFGPAWYCEGGKLRVLCGDGESHRLEAKAKPGTVRRVVCPAPASPVRDGK